jgi:hypothetical protein
MNMTQVSISKPEHSIEDGWHVASSSIAINGKTYQIKYRASEGPIARGAEPFLAAALLPAMKVGHTLRVSGTVSPKLLAATETIQNIYHQWFPEFQKIPVHGEADKLDKVIRTDNVGAFFSGGVDSFFTLLKHRDEINKVILIHGFNQYYSADLRSKVTKVIRQVARDFNKPLIEVETNVRELSDQYCDFTDHFVGILLTSVGILLAPQFRKIYIPATFSYAHLHPAGTHPLVDPLWSTESVSFEHDGCEANRAEKTAQIAQSDIALRSLRVCFSSMDDYNNCGRCQKCLRTMLALQAAGALERCTTFNRKLDPEVVARMNIGHPENIHFLKENLQALENSENNNGLVDALRVCINNNEFVKMADNLNQKFGEFLASARGKKFVKGKQSTLFRALWESNSNFLVKEALKESLKELDKKFLLGVCQKLFISTKATNK